MFLPETQSFRGSFFFPFYIFKLIFMRKNGSNPQFQRKNYSSKCEATEIQLKFHHFITRKFGCF